MEINVDLTRSDYADFNQYYHYKKGVWKKIRTVIVAAILIPALVNFGKPFYLDTYLINIIIAFIVFGSIYLGLGYLTIKRTGKLPSENGAILGKRKFIVTDDGLLEVSDNNKNLQKWISIKSIESNKNSIFIFIDKIAAYVIPKRSFESEKHMEDFLLKINEKINTLQQG